MTVKGYAMTPPRLPFSGQPGPTPEALRHQRLFEYLRHTDLATAALRATADPGQDMGQDSAPDPGRDPGQAAVQARLQSAGQPIPGASLSELARASAASLRPLPPVPPLYRRMAARLPLGPLRRR
ncbi:hypothetical protein ACX9MO_18970 [Pseudooceanicola sp. 502str34]